MAYDIEHFVLFFFLMMAMQSKAYGCLVVTENANERYFIFIFIIIVSNGWKSVSQSVEFLENATHHNVGRFFYFVLMIEQNPFSLDMQSMDDDVCVCV